MRARPTQWFDTKYAIPAHEKLVLQACSKEDGPVDFIITVKRVSDFTAIYRLYKVDGTHDARGVKMVKYTGKQNSDPTVLEDVIFGH